MAESEMMLAGPGMLKGRRTKTSSPTSGKRIFLSRTPLTKGRSEGSGWLGVVAAIVRNVEEEDEDEEECDLYLGERQEFSRGSILGLDVLSPWPS